MIRVNQVLSGHADGYGMSRKDPHGSPTAISARTRADLRVVVVKGADGDFHTAPLGTIECGVSPDSAAALRDLDARLRQHSDESLRALLGTRPERNEMATTLLVDNIVVRATTSAVPPLAFDLESTRDERVR